MPDAVVTTRADPYARLCSKNEVTLSPSCRASMIWSSVEEANCPFSAARNWSEALEPPLSWMPTSRPSSTKLSWTPDLGPLAKV
jgi:hypothetical protein